MALSIYGDQTPRLPTSACGRYHSFRVPLAPSDQRGLSVGKAMPFLARRSAPRWLRYAGGSSPRQTTFPKAMRGRNTRKENDMPTLTKGSFSLDLGIVRLGAELSDEDRQCAWELYTELATRVALTGKCSDQECTDFEGELYIESLASLYSFFQEARQIMRKFPVGRITVDNQRHLGVIISRVMETVLRPFLEKWQADYRFWWESRSNPRLDPVARQSEYPVINEFLNDWVSLRWLMRKLQNELIDVYKLVDVGRLRSN